MEQVKVSKRLGDKCTVFIRQKCMQKELEQHKGTNVQTTIYKDIIKTYNVCESAQYDRQAALAKERVLLANIVSFF